MSGFERVGSGGLTCRFTSDPQANQITQVPPLLRVLQCLFLERVATCLLHLSPVRNSSIILFLEENLF